MRARRGNYVLLLLVALVVMLGFGALAVDTSYVLTTRGQAQDVADAASIAALIALRQTGDRDRAEEAAGVIVRANEIARGTPELISLRFGSWDTHVTPPIFYPDSVHPNAVRVSLGRRGEDGVPYQLARIWGYTRFDAVATATAATRSTAVMIVLDITGSWGEADFNGARAAVLGAVDLLAETATGVDAVGMVIFTNRFAWAYTPFVPIALADNADEVREQWAELAIASKAGEDDDPLDGTNCDLNTGAAINDFNHPPGGCYPAMPREYRDEPGTDHSAGILLAKELFEEHTTGADYRAMIVLTDGRPNALSAQSGDTRDAQGYVEDRWREYRGDVPRTQDQIRTASIDATTELWETLGVNTWVVSLVAHDWMMPAMVQGDGSYVLTTDSTQLAAILAQIISELPLALVE